MLEISDLPPESSSMMKLAILLSFLGMATPLVGTAAEMTKLDRTPFFVTKVKVGNQLATMLVDTGASDTVLFDWFATKSGLSISESNHRGTDSGGNSFKLRMATVSGISLGGKKKNTAMLPIVPTVSTFRELNIGGIFSPLSFFEKEELLIDFPKRSLVSASDAKNATLGRKPIAKLPLLPCGKKYAVNAKINGVSGLFYLDTGGQRSVVTEAFSKKLGSLIGTNGERQGVASKRSVVSVSGVQLDFGGSVNPISIDIESKKIGCAPADGKLGNDVLGSYALSFNSERTELSLFE